MDNSKWFAISRGIWAAAIPLIIAVLMASGVDTTNLASELDTLGTAFALVVSGVLTLRSRFKPDNATLTALPTLKP